jgi:hypothetical protein
VWAAGVACSTREYATILVLKPQDLVVPIHLALHAEPCTYPALSRALGLSASEAHAAIRRATTAGLFNGVTRRPNKSALLELLLHGARYVYPLERGALTWGVPTAHGVEPLVGLLSGDSDAAPVARSHGNRARGGLETPVSLGARRSATRHGVARGVGVFRRDSRRAGAGAGDRSGRAQEAVVKSGALVREAVRPTLTQVAPACDQCAPSSSRIGSSVRPVTWSFSATLPTHPAALANG